MAEGRFDWERFIRELARIMPARSWLQTTDATTTPAATVAPDRRVHHHRRRRGPTAKLIGCTPEQSDVARMMVRMQRMYRVTDVTLNESVARGVQRRRRADRRELRPLLQV